MKDMMRMIPRAIGLALTCGCADDLTPNTDAPEPSATVVTEALEGELFMTAIDASDRERWVYFSFAEAAEVDVGDPATSTEWDLAFQRFNVLSNGGASGSGGRAVAILDGMQLEAVTSAPADGYVEDRPDSEDEDRIADSAFADGDGWYDYDSADNTLSPKPIVYVLRAPGPQYYALAFSSYYDDAGTSAHPSFRWRIISAP